MSFAEQDIDRASELIERLLVDAAFRAEFRADPLAACRAHGLDSLAAELSAGGSALQTLELRESRSSLAGVVLAIAAEGVGFVELRGLLGNHGLRGPARAAAFKALRAEGIAPPRGRSAGLAAIAQGSHRIAGGGHGGLAGAGRAAAGSGPPLPAGQPPGGAAGQASGGAAAQPVAGVGAQPVGAAAQPVAGVGAQPVGVGAQPLGGAGAPAAGGPPPAGVTPVDPVGATPADPAGAAPVNHAGAPGAVATAGGGAGGIQPQPAGNGVPDLAQLPGGRAPGPSLSGKISWFGGPNDPTAGSMTASGAPISRPGIAVYNQQTLGGYWLVKMPNGRQAVLQQTDIGPAPWTGRKVDFTYSALPQLGYSEQSFPTDASIDATYLGKSPPSGAAVVAASGAGAGAGAPISSAPAGGAGAPISSAPGAGAGAWPGAAQPVYGGSTPGVAAELLASPRVAMPAGVRTLLAQGAVDPRIVSVLASAAANHSLALGGFESVADPVHSQGVDIVAVDGQPVGPSNVGARDLITEIAALDPSLRPSEIGSPWAIRSPGFFTDLVHQNRLHLGFVSAADYAPPGGGWGSAGGGGSSAGAWGPGAGPGPVAGVPGAAGVAQAANAALAAESAPAAAMPPELVGQAPAPAGAPVAELVAQAPAGAPGDPFFASPKAHSAFETAKSQLGVRYQWGGTSPQTGFDCSGLMQWAYGKVGISIPRVAADQFHAGTPVDLQHLREGDLVFFQDSTGYIHHVGMYVGNHRFLEAPHTGDVVKYADLREPYWAQQFAGGRRIVPLAAPAAVAAGPAASPVVGSTPGAVATPAGSAAAALGTAAAQPAASGVPDPGAAQPGAATPGSAQSAAPGPAQSAAAGPLQSAAAGPPQPGTGVFRALERQERAFHRHTMQFLAAVQPGAAPVAGGAVPGGSAGALGAQPAPVGAQPVPLGAQPAPLGAGPVAGPGAGAAADQQALAVGQGLVAGPAGGAISVTSSLLTSGQQKFAGRLAELTGLDPRVISAWELAEESGGAAAGRQAAGNFNWLNIGYFDSGAGAIAFDQAFRDPVAAAEQTANFLKGKWGGASTGIRAIMNSVGQDPQAQISAIANSGWASSGYSGGANLRATYDELSGIQVSRA